MFEYQAAVQYQPSDQHGSSSDPLPVLLLDDMKWFMYHNLLTTDASNSGAGLIRGNRQALRDDFVFSSYSNRRVFGEDDAPETIEIPIYVFSSATFEYMGLAPDAAADCWNRFTSAVVDRVPVVEDAAAFVACAKDHLRMKSKQLELCAQDEWSYWAAVMWEIGCSAELATAMMTKIPESKAIRGRKSVLYWVLDTLDLRWKALMSLMSKSRERVRQMRVGGWVPVDGEYNPSTLDRHPARRAPRKLVDHVKLWKGVDEDSLEDLLLSNGGIYRMETLLTCSPDDFNRTSSGYYFATDKSVAIAYAKWIQQRTPASSGVVISFQVPESVINGLEKAELGHPNEDDAWAKFAWSCRSQANGPQRLPHAEQQIADELEKKELIVGHMSGCSLKEILEMESHRNIT